MAGRTTHDVALIAQALDAAGNDRRAAVIVAAEVGLGQEFTPDGLEDLEFGEGGVESLLEVVFRWRR
jgi:hypothetical protein